MIVRLIATTPALVTYGARSFFVEQGREVLLDAGPRLVVEAVCEHPPRSLRDPRPAAWTGGPDRQWVVTCSDCGGDVVLGAVGGARDRALGREFMAGRSTAEDTAANQRAGEVRHGRD